MSEQATQTPQIFDPGDKDQVAQMEKDRRTRREKEAGGKLLTIKQAEQMGFHELFMWMREAKPFVALERSVEIFHMGDGYIRLRLYTDRHCYNIQAHLGTKTRGDYLGCTGGARMPRAGSSMAGGNDLHDGRYNREGWFQIMADIVSYELVPLEV